MNKSILIVAAHSDDEVIGCGGTIARHVIEGDFVYVIFIADGVSSRNNKNIDIIKRQNFSENAKKILGIHEIYNLGMPDNQLDKVPLLDIIKSLEKLFKRIKPSIVYTHHYGDLNIDHCITNKAVMTLCRPIPESSVKEIYSFEVLSSTEWAAPYVNPFIPTHYVNIEFFLDKKINALKAYEDEMRPSPHSRSIDHCITLAHHRGNSIGINAAEAFMTIRTIK